MRKTFVFGFSKLTCLMLLATFQTIPAQDLPIIHYPGTTVPGSTPIPFATSLITDNPWRIDFRPDGKEFYYVYWNDTVEIKKVSQYIDGQWTEPTQTLLHNSALSTNGKGYYCKNDGINDTLYSFNWSETGQTEAKPCAVLGSYAWASVASNSNFYLSANNGDGNWDIYLSKFENDTFQAPVRLSDSINSTKWEQHMFIAPDESYILFDVQTPWTPGSISDASVYVSFRKPDGTWSARKNLNLPGYMCCVSPDGKYIFFQYNGVIRWVDIKIIDKYRPVTTSIIQGRKLEFNIYPNPTSSKLNIAPGNAPIHEYMVEIYSSDGKRILSIKFLNSSMATLDLTNFPKGMYLVKIDAGTEILTEKITKN
jgi:hypothetical protein